MSEFLAIIGFVLMMCAIIVYGDRCTGPRADLDGLKHQMHDCESFQKEFVDSKIKVTTDAIQSKISDCRKIGAWPTSSPAN